MGIYQYCKSLITFYMLKTRFENSAFKYDSPGCIDHVEHAVVNANNMYLFITTNNRFINEMKKGCKRGGNDTKCKINNLCVNDILNDFNTSYYSYIEYPTILCTPFSEFTNNLESLFITGGCYLDNTTNQICDLHTFKC